MLPSVLISVGVKNLSPLTLKRKAIKMPKYTYKFNDGTTSTVEVSEEHYKLLTNLDKEERTNNRKQRRFGYSVPFPQCKDEWADEKRDKEFERGNA